MSRDCVAFCGEGDHGGRFSGFRQTASDGTPHLDRACRIRDESFDQSPIEQKAANALEPGMGPLSAASPRRDVKRNSTRRFSNRKPSIPATFWIPLCRLRLNAPPLTFHSHHERKTSADRRRRLRSSAVLPSEIEQLPDLRGFLKFESTPSWKRGTLRIPQ